MTTQRGRMAKSTVRGRVVTMIVMALIGTMAWSPSAASALDPLPETGVLDVNDFEDGASSCGGGEDSCTLRAAIAKANSEPSLTSIRLPAGRYELDPTKGPLKLEENGLLIFGAFAPMSDDPTLVDANGGRAFEILANDVTLAGIAITGASAGSGDGGAITVARAKRNFTLSQSTITGNTAGSGAGLLVAGPNARVEQSTFADNAATGKGAGIRVENRGSVVVENSTFTLNTAQSGGAISVAGTATVAFSTFLDNTSNNVKGAGVDRNGGSVSITGSILTQANQQDSTGSDCSGNPDLVGVNYVGNAQGCNPDPDLTVVRDTADPTTVLILGSLADNGGATGTIALLGGSTGAIDRSECTAFGQPVDADQRGSDRPGGAACDLGAYEILPLDVAVTLGVDATEVGVGVVSVPVEDIVPELLGRVDPITTSNGPEGTALNSIALNSIALNSIALNSIALNSIALNSIALNSIALNSIALNSIQLSDIPLADPEGGWAAFLEGTEFEGFPIQSLTLEDLAYSTDTSAKLSSVSLLDLDLSSTALNSIALHSILLADTALNSIALNSIEASSNAEAWCTFLGSELCDLPDPGDDAYPAALAELEEVFGQLTLLNLEFIEGVPPIPVDDIGLASIALNSIALNSIALNSIDLANTALNSIALNSIDPAASALNSIALNSIDLNSIALNSIALNSIDLANTALNSIALNSIALNSIDIDCTAFDCTNGTVGEALAAGAFGPDVTLADLLAALSPTDLETIPLTDLLPVLGDLTIGDLDLDGLTLGEFFEIIAPVIEGFTLADLLLAFLSPEEIPFETIDLENALLQNVADPLQPAFHYTATIEVSGGPADLDVTLRLPDGFAFATALAPGAGAPATFAGEIVEPTNDDLEKLQFTLPGVASGSYELVVAARAGLTTGESTPASIDVTASTGASEAFATALSPTVNVTEAVEADGPGSSPAVLGLDGELQLAHVSRSDDVDLYQFTVPATLAGRSARVLLSNIPTGVDYDLTLYAPPAVGLRGDPSQDLAAIPDVGFDLDPTDDVYATDVVQDIPQTTPQDWLGEEVDIRGISSRRSSEDELVTTGPLRPGETYYVQVSSFNGDLSNQPYAIRLRLDNPPPLPDCAVGPREFRDLGDDISDLPSNYAPMALADEDGDGIPDLQDNINTLFITNTQWLKATLGSDGAAGVLAAVNAINGKAGAISALVPVDVAATSEYDDWRNNRCDVDARNAVVSAIGDVIDEIVAEYPTVENVVLVGGDGVVPMAAIPDLTKIANETTFAPEVVTPNIGENGEPDGTFNGNELSAALGAGYLLSDDPYGVVDDGTGCTGCIAVGDHQLYMAQLNLGRLVETADQITTSLQHFVDYDGQLDPESFGSALVSGYDFLTDGAVEAKTALVDDGLEVNGGSVPDPLINDTWERQELLDGLATPGLDVVSPNAHYDYESLLPAAQDTNGSWVPEELVFVHDLAGISGVPADDTLNNPERAVIAATIGCHAGLSVDDIQLGFAGTDWAETYAAGNNTLIGHTTFGYGDSEIVAYSEELLVEVLARLSEMTVGEAVRYAKSEVLGSTVVLDPYTEKILQSFTNYGLPMYRMGGGIDNAATMSMAAVTGLIEETEPAGPILFGATNGGATPVSIDVATGDGTMSGPGILQPVTTEDGSYFEHDGDVLALPYRPVQPLGEFAVPAGIEPRGFLITELESEDLDGFVPLNFLPTIDLGGREPRVVPGDGSFPATLTELTTVDTPDGPEHRLLQVLGQFQDGLENDGLPNRDVQRLFTHVGGELLSVPEDGAAAADTEGPLFKQVVGRLSEQGQEDIAEFEVVVEDAARCVLLFRLPEAQTWTSIDLNQVGTTTTWLGAAPVNLPANVQAEFFVNCADVNNNTALTVNKVDNYLATEVTEFGNLDITLSSPANPDGPQNGYFRGPVTATVDVSEFIADFGDQDYMFEYSIDSQQFKQVGLDDVEGGILTIPETISGTGGHAILVRDNALIDDDGVLKNRREYRFLVIDDLPPTVTITAETTTAADAWSASSVSVSISATDAGPSGVDSVTYSYETVAADGTTTSTGPVTIQDDSTTFDVGTEGVTTITATTTDVAGNVSAETTEVVYYDETAPTFQCSAQPDRTVWYPTNQSVTCTVTDSGAGFDGSATTTVELITTVPDGEFDANAVAGPETVTDDANRPVEVQAGPFKIDRELPALTWTLPTTGPANWASSPIDITLRATDAGSGFSSLTYSYETVAAGGTTSSGPTTPPDNEVKFRIGEGVTTITATASDVAGNTSTETRTVYSDGTAPTYVCPPGPDRTTWYNTNQTVTCTVTDTGAGFLVNGIRQSTKTVVLSTNVDAGQFSATAVAGPATVADDAGNDVLVQTASFKVDREIPVIVDPSEPLALGGTVTPVCTDAGSGIANCVAGPADTSEPGSVDVSVSATDVAGNTVTRTVTYEVAYGICLNYDPTKTNNPGSSVPIKVFLCDAAGNNLSSNQIVLTAVGIDDGAAAPNSTGKSNDDPYEFRYSSKDGQYIYTFDSTGLTAQPDPHLFKFVIGSSSVVYSVPFRISAG